MNQQPDRIEKTITLRASRSRIWRALTTPEEFGAWFGVKFEGAHFKPGERMKGRITTQGYEHLTFEIVIERLEPERVFSYRWHPYAIDPTVDYSTEPSTLVEFVLEDAGDSIDLRVVESGFEQIPAARRAIAFRMNDGGWTEQTKNIERYVAN